jgi:hypothetical protein
MKQEELDKIIKIVDESYYYSDHQYGLNWPESASYNAKGEKNKKWSCPMRPTEISSRIENACYLMIDDLNEKNYLIIIEYTYNEPGYGRQRILTYNIKCYPDELLSKFHERIKPYLSCMDHYDNYKVVGVFEMNLAKISCQDLDLQISSCLIEKCFRKTRT